MSHPQPEHEKLLSKFGHLVSLWNDVEYQWKSCLIGFETPDCPNSKTAMVLMAHLGSLQFLDAAKTVANEIVTGECRSVLLEAIAQLDILREYRNYYVHGFQAVGWRPDGAPIGLLITATARGRLTQHDLWFDAGDLETLIAALEPLRTVFGGVLLVWRGNNDPLTGAPYKLPVLPSRHPRLEKTKRSLFGPNI